MWKKIVKFLKEVRVEMEKVSWPSVKEVINWTLVVVFVAGLVAFIIGFFDYLFFKLMEYFLNF